MSTIELTLPKYPYPLLMCSDKTAMYNLINSRGTNIIPEKLSLSTTPDRYIFAISINDPHTILIHPNTHFYRNSFEQITYTIEDDNAGLKNGKIRTTYNHNNLVKNDDVVSCGEIYIQSNKIIINNQSGHYCPDYTSLDYVEQLLKYIGFQNIEKHCVIQSIPNLNTFKQKVINKELWEKYGIE